MCQPPNPKNWVIRNRRFRGFSHELTHIKRHRGGETGGRQKGSLTHGKKTPAIRVNEDESGTKKGCRRSRSLFCVPALSCSSHVNGAIHGHRAIRHANNRGRTRHAIASSPAPIFPPTNSLASKCIPVPGRRAPRRWERRPVAAASPPPAPPGRRRRAPANQTRSRSELRPGRT